MLQATGSGEWNAVFPQLTTQGAQQMELPDSGEHLVSVSHRLTGEDCEQGLETEKQKKRSGKGKPGSCPQVS